MDHAAGKARPRKQSPLDLLLHDTSPAQQMRLPDANAEEDGATQAVEVAARAAIEKALAATAQDKRPIVGEAVAWAQAMRTREAGKEAKNTMLTVIEKVLFLKEAPFFADMSIDQLRILAAISEEVDYGSDETIAAKGEEIDTLYVVIQGKVAVQSTETTPRGQTSVRRLATLGPRDYFGEMSVFDNQPFASSVVTIRPTKLLSVRQAPLLALIGLHPDLGLSLLRVFSMRLRKFMSLAEERTTGRPKQLMDLYDKFE
jgi:CRP-like cAMP-binding protein